MQKIYIKILFSLSFLLHTLASNAQKDTLSCPGKNGSSKKIESSENSRTYQIGVFKCDTLVDGHISYCDTAGQTLYILKFKNRIYQGEIDPKTNKPKKNISDHNGVKLLAEDGEFKNGYLWSGKKYMYDKIGLLYKILIFKNGRLIGEAKFD